MLWLIEGSRCQLQAGFEEGIDTPERAMCSLQVEFSLLLVESTDPVYARIDRGIWPCSRRLLLRKNILPSSSGTYFSPLIQQILTLPNVCVTGLHLLNIC